MRCLCAGRAGAAGSGGSSARGRRGPPQPPLPRRTGLPLPGQGRYPPGEGGSGGRARQRPADRVTPAAAPRKMHFLGWKRVSAAFSGAAGPWERAAAGQDAPPVCTAYINICVYVYVYLDDVYPRAAQAAAALPPRLAPAAPRLCAPALPPPPSRWGPGWGSPQPPHPEQQESGPEGSFFCSLLPSAPPPLLPGPPPPGAEGPRGAPRPSPPTPGRPPLPLGGKWRVREEQ